LPSSRFCILLAVYSATMSVAAPDDVFACRCTEPTPGQAYRAAASVAYGKVVSVRKEKDGAEVLYVFEVTQSWKRRVEPQITIRSGTTCSFEADVGETYVIFLKQYKPDIYETAICMGNRPEAKARELLNYLREVKPTK
jgi:hypothetical protein